MNASETMPALKARRKAAGIPQHKLAPLLGWTQSILSAKESGKRRVWLDEVDKWRDALEELGA